MIYELFPAVIAVITVPQDDVSSAAVPFLSTFVLRIKKLYESRNVLSEKEKSTIQAILNGVLMAARYPFPSSIPSGSYSSDAHRVAGEEEIENVGLKRRDLFTIFKNIVRIDSEMVASTLLNQLRIILPYGDAPFQVD